MRLTHLHPGSSLKRIKAKTGFAFEVADPLGLTQDPTDRELILLRETIDPLGIRELERLSGPARKAKIKEILAKDEFCA